MREIGAVGGRASVRSRLGLDVLDNDRESDKLRAKARKRLEALLDSDDEALRLRAASALYSYRSAPPPADEPREQQGKGKPVVLADLVSVAVECGLVVPENGGAVIVDGKRIERVDPLPGAKERDPALSIPVPPARANNESESPPLKPAELDLGTRSQELSELETPSLPPDPAEERGHALGASLSRELPEPGAADFDESEQGRLRRRYGSITPDQWRWA